MEIDMTNTTAAVADAVASDGLLPSPTQELVRKIVASPLSGRLGGRADVRPWVGELDLALQADRVLAGLPGRFMFSIDDGTADVSGLAADVGVQVVDDDVALLLAGHDTGVRLGADEAVAAMISVATRFAESRGTAWRIRELDDPAPLLAGFTPVCAPMPIPAAPRPPVGWIEQDDGRVALGAAVPLGVLSARQAQFVAAIEAPVVITPWRSLLVCDLTEGVADTSLRVLAPLGLVFDTTSPWLDVTACVGSPGCERSRADVRAEATRVAESGFVDGAVSTGTVPTAISITTGTTAGTERMRITSAGLMGIGTGTPASCAIVDVTSTTKGFKFPVMTTAERNLIGTPVAGLVIFDSTLAKLCVYSVSAWQTITSV
jgi:precorrin-3B synthase